MAETKYGENIVSLEFTDRPGLYRQVTSFNGKSCGLEFHVEYGTYWAAGQMGANPNKMHTHEYDQALVFLGTNADRIGELGAEIELCLGTECEKHIFTTSTVVSVPRGTPHFPATINNLDRRFIYMEVSCTTECRETPVEVTAERLSSPPVLTWESKYDPNILNMAFVRKGAWHYGPKNRDDSGGYLSFIGSKTPEFNFLIMHETITKAPYRFLTTPDKPHVHTKAEILTFMGTDTNDLSDLGGEVEVTLGKEAEKHTITRSSAIIIPGKLPHGPVIVTRADRPLFLTDIRPFGTELPKVRKY